MKILMLTSNYPSKGAGLSGVFNQKCAKALRDIGHHVNIIAPRPYAPKFLPKLLPRWKFYSTIPFFQRDQDFDILRPAYIQIPKFGRTFCMDYGAYFLSRNIVNKLHKKVGFDAILASDLVGTALMGWRFGQTLGIPSAAWMMGHMPAHPAIRRAIGRAIVEFDVVFYQNLAIRAETIQEVKRLYGQELPLERHLVLPHGIPAPPRLNRKIIRTQVRKKLNIKSDQIVVLNIGRVTKDKGIFELIESVSLAAQSNCNIKCLIVGSIPAIDHTHAIQKLLNQKPELKKHITLLPAVTPAKVWEYLCAADIFAFTSHHEGMPNSLLEAMGFGLPVVGFGIPPLLEVDSTGEALKIVPCFDSTQFANSLVHLACSPFERKQRGEKGKTIVLERFMVTQNMAKAVEILCQLTQQTPAITQDFSSLPIPSA